MNTLAILSRDAGQYRQIVLQAGLPNLDVVVSETQWHDNIGFEQASIVLADPDLIAPHLHKCAAIKWLQSTWAGVKPVIDSCASAHDAKATDKWMFTGVKVVFGAQMREYVFTYLLHFSRDVAGFEQKQRDRQWDAPLPVSLAGKTLGIMGVGSIGKAVAKAAKAFDMRVLGLTHSSRDCEAVDEYFTLTDTLTFAAELDYLVCLLPHTEQTENLIDGVFFRALPSHTVLINAGRGQVIDDDALISALDSEQLHAAVLDVFREEPLPADHPFWLHPKVHMTNHTAAVSRPADIAALFVSNYQRFVHQQPLHYQIDWQKGY